MRKIVLLGFAAVGLAAASVVVPQVATPAFACLGSCEPGLVPWRGPSALGPWGIQPQPRHQRHQRYVPGGVYYHARPRVQQRIIVVTPVITQTRMCHDWKLVNGVKVYTRHYAC